MQILKKMVDIFTEELPDQIAALHRAIEQQSPEDLRQAAHALKGAVANFDATAAYQSASALEQMGKSSNLSHARPNLPNPRARVVCGSKRTARTHFLTLITEYQTCPEY